jgi:CheY-like chemotaxis protein
MSGTVAQRAIPPYIRSKVPVTSSRKPALLIVDDDLTVRQLLSLALEQHGYATYVAADGSEAIACYQAHWAEIDLVLLDVRMPDLDGPQTLAALRRIDPQVRCCFISGETAGYSLEDLEALGSLHFFTKPFHLTEVLRVLARILGNHTLV